MHNKSKRCGSPGQKPSASPYSRKYALKPSAGESTQVSEPSQSLGEVQRAKSKKRSGARRYKKQKAGRKRKLAAESLKPDRLCSSLALTPFNSEQAPVRSQLLTSATSRGRSTTFWADLNQTYFQSVDLPLANLHYNQLKLACLPPQSNHSSDAKGKLGENFSLYDYFQDVLATGLQDLVLSSDPEEVDLLRKVFVVDQHLIFEDSHANATHLLGHSITPVQKNVKFSTDFFEAIDARGQPQSQDLDTHLEWLTRELALTQRQVSANYDQLLGKIHHEAKTECSQNQLIQRQSNILTKFFVRNILHMEMVQLAESIRLVKASRQVPDNQSARLPAPAYFQNNQTYQQAESDSNTQYLLSFDKSLFLADVWVSPSQLEDFNRLRSEMAGRLVKPRVVDDNQIESETLTVNAPLAYLSDESDELDSIPRNERIRGFDMDQLEYCHHCMQLKQAQIHVRCRYQSSKHHQKVGMPASLHVNGVKVFNAETYKPGLANSLILKKLIKDKKRRGTLEESLEISCSKQYCSFCLKNFHDTNFSAIKKDPNWCCPHCVGQCFCSRCRRQEQMATAKGFLISLNQQSLVTNPSAAIDLLGSAYPSIVGSKHPIDLWIKQNFELFVRTSDLSCKQQREPHQAAFLEPDVSTQQHIIQLTRKPLTQSQYEPVLRKRLHSEVSKFIQGLNVENIQNQIDDKRLIRDIREAKQMALASRSPPR